MIATPEVDTGEGNVLWLPEITRMRIVPSVGERAVRGITAASVAGNAAARESLLLTLGREHPHPTASKEIPPGNYLG